MSTKEPERGAVSDLISAAAVDAQDDGDGKSLEAAINIILGLRAELERVKAERDTAIRNIENVRHNARREALYEALDAFDSAGEADGRDDMDAIYDAIQALLDAET